MLSAIFAFAAVMAVSAQTPPFSGQTVLKPGLNNNYCLTAEGTTDGSIVDMQPCQSNAANQAWTFSGGQVQIYGGSKCLDVKDGVNQDGTHLQIYDCISYNSNQQWYYTSDNR